MPKKAEAKEKESKEDSKSNYYIVILIVAIVIIAALVVTFARGVASGSNISFQQFQSQFNAAPRVAIFATDYNIGDNSTTGQYTFPCMSSLIGGIVANKENHRNSSAIDLYILNETSCARVFGLGPSTGTANSSLTNVSSCNAQIGKVPTIYINYSQNNSTVIENNYLYTSGNAAFLKECGIASEIG